MKQEDLSALQGRVKRLERRLKFGLCGWGASVVVLGLVFAALPPGWTQAGEKPKVLRARSLVIVDEKGTERIRIAAPLPDPVVRGKQSRRRSPANGIQFNDTNGNARGGIGMLDDGTMILCFDYEQGEAVCMFLLPDGQAGFMAQVERGNKKVALATNLPGGKSGLFFTDKAGRVRASLLLNPEGDPMLVLLNAEGKPFHKAP